MLSFKFFCILVTWKAAGSSILLLPQSLTNLQVQNKSNNVKPGYRSVDEYKFTHGRDQRENDLESITSSKLIEKTLNLFLKKGQDRRKLEGEGAQKTWLSLSSVDVSVEWNLPSISGYSVSLEDAHWTVLHDHPFYTLQALKTKQVYTAVITSVGDELSHHFAFTTSSLISAENLYDVMKENKMKNCTDTVKITHVSISVKLEGLVGEGYVIEIEDILQSKPVQWVDLQPNSKTAHISGLLPDMFLRLTLKKVQSSDPIMFQEVMSKTIFSGGCVTVPTFNLTRTLDLFFPTRGTSKWHVRCYADDEVFSGFPCGNSDICVPKNWMCDKEDDCPDGDDEDDCGFGYHSNSYCRKNEFRCVKHREHVCLPISWLCDGRHDCSDGWDEDPRNCRDYYSRPGGLHYQGGACRSSYYRCRNNLGCVSLKFVCDGEDDCADGSDEWNCASDYDCDSYKEFQCFQSQGKERCIPQTWMCDDQEDCELGEDEDFDICRRVL